MFRRGKGTLSRGASTTAILATPPSISTASPLTAVSSGVITSSPSSEHASSYFSPQHSRNFSIKPAFSWLKSKTPAAQTFESKKIGEKHKFTIPAAELTDSYKILHEHANFLRKGFAAFCASSATTSAVAAFSEIPFVHSPATMTAFASALIAARFYVQLRRDNYFPYFSIAENPKNASTSEEYSEQIASLFAGPRPQVGFSWRGLEFDGIKGDKDNPSRAIEKVLSRRDKLISIHLPTPALNPEAAKIINNVYSNWLERFWLPVYIYHWAALKIKSPQDKGHKVEKEIDHALLKMYSLIRGTPLGAARQEFTHYVSQCGSPQEFIKRLIDKKMLDEGALSCIDRWLEINQALTVKITMLGTAHIVPKNSRIDYWFGAAPAIPVSASEQSPAALSKSFVRVSNWMGLFPVQNESTRLPAEIETAQEIKASLIRRN